MEVGKVKQLTQRPVAVAASQRERQRHEPESDDDIRRVMLGMLAVLKRKYPEDWRRIVKDLNEAKAA